MKDFFDDLTPEGVIKDYRTQASVDRNDGGALNDVAADIYEEAANYMEALNDRLKKAQERESARRKNCWMR